MIMYSVHLFKGVARDWLRIYVSSNPNPPLLRLSLEVAFLSKYQPLDPVIKDQDRLAKLKQTKSVSTSINLFCEIIMEVHRIADDKRLARISNEVHLHQPVKCDKAIFTTEHYDEAVSSYEGRNRHRPSVIRSDVMDVDATHIERRIHPRGKSAKAHKSSQAKWS